MALSRIINSIGGIGVGLVVAGSVINSALYNGKDKKWFIWLNNALLSGTLNPNNLYSTFSNNLNYNVIIRFIDTIYNVMQ